ncbi:hypothetical protein AVEN_126476-1 [Araneus ventricosus]|uniref:Uncharacterized protein n=1 Tax=Araneus ventricosus TaxID=182803 RepID=A0A4Y2RKL0_ARAVE|nr:hypothetical protein AVEN_126476-1 [Araneus ventricosus]
MGYVKIKACQANGEWAGRGNGIQVQRWENKVVVDDAVSNVPGERDYDSKDLFCLGGFVLLRLENAAGGAPNLRRIHENRSQNLFRRSSNLFF